MSHMLRKVGRKLLKIANLKIKQIKTFLKKINRNTIGALSEIAYNIAEGVVAAKKLARTKLVRILADKKVTNILKRKALNTAAAAATVKALIVAVLPVLKSLVGDG